MKKIIFFVIIIGLVVAAAGFWYWAKNPFSKEILKLEILGPKEADAFDEVEYTVKYKNNGDVRLEEPRLIFEFPENTLPVFSPDEAEQEQKYLRRKEVGAEELGDIYPGEEKTFTFKARLFGKKDEVKTAKAKMSYRPKNLNAVFESDTTFNTIIESVPLSFDLDIPSKIETGRDFRFSLNYFSSSDYPISNLTVKTEYPLGFEFLKSIPGSLGKNEWDISLLNKAEGGRVEIDGRLSGELNEQKLFKASLGIWQENEFIVLKESARAVEITKPRIFVFQQANGSNQYVAEPDDLLHYEIFFRNISEEPFNNLFLAVRLEGKAFDFDTIKTADNGQFNKGDSSIVWDWRDVEKLRFLGRGEEGKVEFWINLKDWQISSPQEKDALLKDSVIISQAKEEFEIKVNSKLEISQKGYFNNDVFGNTGPIPPRVGERTTYTIIWQAKNYYNDVDNVKVEAILPDNVELTGEVFPEEQKSNFTFDRLSREIIWRVGDMKAGTGVLDSPPNIAFQVALTPEAGQRGGAALIIGEAKIRGEDRWTERITEGTDSGIDTTLPDDSSISGKGIVE